MILSGKELSARIKEEIKGKCSAFEQKTGRKPGLAVVLVGNNPASVTYVSGKRKACEEVGIEHFDCFFPDTVKQEELIECVNTLNANCNVDGILVQLPLPSHIDEATVVNAIKPEKDVDGFTPSNTGKLLLGEKGFVACTPKGITRLLDYYRISTQGKNVCIVGRSNIVGKPMAAILVQRDRNATVTVCNSFTPDLASYIRKADIVISAAGRVNLITSDMVKEGAVVIDVGMNRVPDSSKKSGYCLRGDVDFENVASKAYAITPVPGGVGPMTITMLMENTLIAACAAVNTEVSSL